MASVLVTVAQAVSDELLAATTLGVDLTPVLSGADFDAQLAELGTLRVDVVPISCKSELLTRSKLQYTAQVDVLVRKKFAANDRETNGQIKYSSLTAMLALMEKIAEYFVPAQPNQTGRQLTTMTEATWDGGSEIKTNYSRKMLRESGQFSGWVSLVFKVTKVAGS